MFLRLETLRQKMLIGMVTPMSFSENKTLLLWRSFMPRRHTIDSVGSALYSVEVYPENFFEQFDPETVFEKWAATQVAKFDNIPKGMQTIVLPEGLYAVFLHKGAASQALRTYRFIFDSWIPQSGYAIANRPHFAVMGEKYKQESADSEEEIWIPIQPKSRLD